MYPYSKLPAYFEKTYVKHIIKIIKTIKYLN